MFVGVKYLAVFKNLHSNAPTFSVLIAKTVSRSILKGYTLNREIPIARPLPRPRPEMILRMIIELPQ